MERHQIHFGKKFYQTSQGYWVCTKDTRLYAHRWTWMMFFGEIPKSMEIHHIDEDRSNNDITNLQMLGKSQHRKFHWRKRRENPLQMFLPF